MENKHINQEPMEWEDLVERATTFESWCRIITYMFEDGLVTSGRLVTLHRYTQDVIDNLQKKENQTEEIVGETDSEKIAKRYIKGILNITKNHE